jgi:predicted outer membrane repeat protein
MKKMLLIFTIIAAFTLSANTWYVNSLTGDDLNDGSENSPWEHITFALFLTSAGDTLDLTGSFDLELDTGVTNRGAEIATDVTIRGKGVDNTIVQAADYCRVFYVHPGVTAVFENMSLVDGLDEDSEMGGGIRNDGTLNLFNVKISNCFSIDGGGIYSTGTLTLEDVTLTGNTASTNGGALFASGNTTITRSTLNSNEADYGGGIYFDNSNVMGYELSITNCTFSENIASLDGGAVFLNAYMNGQNPKLQLFMNNCTLAWNIATMNGSGIMAKAELGFIEMDVRNSIFCNDLAYNYDENSNTSTISKVFSYNICTDSSLPDATVNGNIANTDPMLELLSDNGGFTMTHALMRNSPAINAISFTDGIGDWNGAPLDDQRGELIFHDDKDIGAYEYNTNKRFFVNIDTGDNANDGSESAPWKYICYSVNNPELIDGDTIDVTGTFLLNEDPDVSIHNGASVYDDLVIQGQGADVTFIKAHPDSGVSEHRVISLYSDNMTIEDMSIMNGSDNTGGGILTGGSLTLNNVNISNCSATVEGGGLYMIAAVSMINTSITNCSIFNNHSSGNGGGIYLSHASASEKSLNIENCTISGNSTDAYGSGLYIDCIGGSNQGPTELNLNVNSCSFVGNTFETLFFLNVEDDYDSAIMNLNIKNSLFENFNTVYYADNTGTLNFDRSFTLCNDTSLPDGSVNGNQNNVDIMLFPLSDNGGGAYTHALQEGSPAVDAISFSSGSGNWNGAPLLDQRGISIINNMKDIGAYEGFISETIGIPQNVSISVTGSQITLEWDEVTGAISYDIYSSSDPYGTFNIEDTVATNSWTGTYSAEKLFYYIKASN